MILVERDYRLVGGIVSVALLWSGYMITQRTRGATHSLKWIGCVIGCSSASVDTCSLLGFCTYVSNAMG